MGTKGKKKSRTKELKKKSASESHQDRVYRVLITLNHKALQKECILRGMDPAQVVSVNHFELTRFFSENFDNTKDLNKLVEFDAWRDQQLVDQGHMEKGKMVHPHLRMGYTKGIEGLEKIPDSKKPDGVIAPTKKKPDKPKAEVNATTGVREGTKKALTFNSAYAGVSMEDTITAVKEVFPEAEEKSIKIWYKRAQKQQKPKD